MYARYCENFVGLVGNLYKLISATSLLVGYLVNESLLDIEEKCKES